VANQGVRKCFSVLTTPGAPYTVLNYRDLSLFARDCGRTPNVTFPVSKSLRYTSVSHVIFEVILSLSTTFYVCCASAAGQTAAAGAPTRYWLQTLQQELDRAMSSLSKADPAPYFISYAGNEEFGSVIMASNGALMANIKRHDRTVDVSVRVGSRELDNTHGENRFNAVTTASLPLEDKPDAIARVLWINTDRMYRKAAQGFLEIKTNTKSPCRRGGFVAGFFGGEAPGYIGKEIVPPKFDQHEWEEKVRRLSAIFKKIS